MEDHQKTINLRLGLSIPQLLSTFRNHSKLPPELLLPAIDGGRPRVHGEVEEERLVKKVVLVKPRMKGRS
jgi:hypothetical protein